MFRKTLVAGAVAVFLIYNIVSIGLAYRAGQQSIQDEQLKNALLHISNAIDAQKKQNSKYEALSQDFATTSAQQRAQMKQTESTIHDYLQNIKHRIECIDTDAMRLLNEQINHANASTGTTTTRGNERTYPLRPAANH